MSKKKRTLDQLATKIELEAKKGDKRLLATAKLVRELKLRIENGEAGEGVKWTEWGHQRFGRCKTWLYDLNAIASAEDPEAALAEYHRKNSERQKDYNDRQKESDPERNSVIRLVKEIDIEHVRKVRKYIAVLTGE